jgi:asparagine synthase (glutamine-hydrolysing)
MCGIFGVISGNPDKVLDQAVLNYMGQVLRHRGPDDEGYYVDDHAKLGMRRLSIIDIVTGQQPISNEDKTLWLVFNGEIYNYQELRARLESKGHVFVTESDTEVIIHTYEEYGDRCVEHFNGMFAFAIWDAAQRRLFIARDRLGIKPLYYWASSDQIVFARPIHDTGIHPRASNHFPGGVQVATRTSAHFPGCDTHY